MTQDRPFTVSTSPNHEPAKTLVVGQAYLRMAGVTAVDYLVRHLDSEQIGHVAPEESLTEYRTNPGQTSLGRTSKAAC